MLCSDLGRTVRPCETLFVSSAGSLRALDLVMPRLCSPRHTSASAVRGVQGTLHISPAEHLSEQLKDQSDQLM